ncbi:hypothetical protein ES705_25124 [subsurface metagenome]
MIKQYSTIIILALLALFSLLPIRIHSENDVATALYKEGLKKYILEDYSGAIKDFDTAYRLNPEDAKIRKMYINTLIKLGNIEYKNNNLIMAEKHFLKAYSLSGEDEELQKNLNTIQERLKEQKIVQARLEEPKREIFQEDVEGMKEKTAVAAEITEEVKEGVVRPERLEVRLPFDMEKFIQQQNLENQRVLAEIIEAQKAERESLFKNIEESQRLLDDNIKAQKEERVRLFDHIRGSQKLLDENIKAQKEERVRLFDHIRGNQKLLDENIKGQTDDRKMLFKRMEDNQKLLSDNMKAQRDERETFLKNLMLLAQSQSEDRKLFSRTLMILVGGGIVLAIIIFFGFIILLRKRTGPQLQTVYHEPRTAIEFKTSQLLEYTDKLDETKYITDDNYSEIVRAKRLRELYLEFQKGNPSWDVIQGYISELNHEVKSEILNIIEKKIKSGDESGIGNAMEILLPFITDGDTDIRTRGNRIIKGVSTGAGVFSETELLEGEKGDSEDPLGLSALIPMAKMVDTKTGRINHSFNVADLASRIAREIKGPELEPSIVKRVGLAHDIGFLEIADKILKTKGELTERQFSLIKTHSERGISLLQHVELPPVFFAGIKYHHERLDGSGYPDELKGDEIPLIAKLIAVADFFDAVTSPRPHRPALTFGSCLRMMEKLAGKIFDRKIFNILVGLYKDQVDDEK